MEKKVVKMERILVKMEIVEKMEKIIAILEKIIVTILRRRPQWPPPLRPGGLKTLLRRRP